MSGLILTTIHEAYNARERLMQDIEAIVTEGDQRESPESLVLALRDAVCKHFPVE